MNVIKIKHYQEPKAGYMVVVNKKDKKVITIVIAVVVALALLQMLGVQIYL